MEHQKLEIDCKILNQHELRIQDLTQQLNAAQNIDEKVRVAKPYLAEVQTLLDCPQYGSLKDCQVCRQINSIRKKTGEIILRVQKLAKTG